MENRYISDIMTLFKNVVLNAVGAERDLYKCISDKDVSKAVSMFTENDAEVDAALKEYNPQLHKVMRRPNKYRKKEPPYITEKLPRTRERYINEVELFFLLGKPVIWRRDDGDDEAFGYYRDFISDYRIDTLLRRAKRLAGAETESAIVFHLSRNDGAVKVTPFVAARSTGYRLRTMFNQYGEMMAFAYGYHLKEHGKNVLHYDILTKEFDFYCRKGTLGWEVETFKNPTGKINALYFRQPKAWDGAVPRIEREEMLDSKSADTNNYFADPMAAATADVVDNLADPDKPGRLIQLTGTGSRFEYINPPQNSVGRSEEKRELKDSILFDTFTPDFSYENMRGLGTLSGEAIRRALVLGYIKRENRMEIYGEMVSRMRNVILEICKLLHPEASARIGALSISFEFAEPFDEDKRERWASVASLYGAGVISIETAVEMLDLVRDKAEEVDRIMMRGMEMEALKVEVQKELAGIQDTVAMNKELEDGDGK